MLEIMTGGNQFLHGSSQGEVPVREGVDLLKFLFSFPAFVHAAMLTMQ